MAAQRLLYGRRKGHRLRPGRERLLAERLPELRLGIPEAGRLDLDACFAGLQHFALEIGFGAGEHLAAQAAAHRDVGFIGCEPYLGGVARLLGLIEAQELRNVRLVVDDARLLLAALPDRCLELICILFPDPWPKTRHHKRRIVNPTTAAEFGRLLLPGGELRLATDHGGYARAMLQTLCARPEFRWIAERPQDWRTRPADWPRTRYEQKARAAGHACIYLRFRRAREAGDDHEKTLKHDCGERI